MADTRRDFLLHALAGGAVLAVPRWTVIAAQTPGAPSPKLSEILADREIWGEGIGNVLTSLPAWSAGGVDRVLIFPDQVVAATPFKSPAEAEAARARIAAAKAPKAYEVRPMVAAQRVGNPAVPTLKPEVLRSFPDDQTARLAWKAGDERLLAKGVTIATVRRKHGKADAVETVAVSTERDSRPTVLTVHRYADGAVAFVESDAHPTPGLVDRAILSVPASVAAVFKEKS